MPQTWKRLPLGRHETCPPLFFSYEPSSKSYDLSLTDLVHIWSESLSKKQILTRASKDDTSIDPSEDDDQFSVLLQKIGDALCGVKGSKISLSRSTRENGLELVTSTKLPSPLEPLEWTVRLSRLPQNALTKQILLPVLKGEADRAARLQSLIDLLKEKDWALSKVFEKIESSGVDLSRAFPGLSGTRADRKGGSALSQVSKVIKGVAPFDEKAWNSRFADEGTDRDLGVDIASGLEGMYSWDTVESNLDDWWVGLGSLHSTSDKAKGGKKQYPDLPQRSIRGESTRESDDEFQRQKTPPKLKGTRPSIPADKDMKSKPKLSNQKPADETATDSEDEREPPNPSPPSQKPKPARKGLGAIGAKPKKEPAPKRVESTESESDIPAPSAKGAKKAKLNGLGSIGGGKAKPASRASQPTGDSTASDSSDSGEAGKKAVPPQDVETASESDSEATAHIPRKRKEPETKRDQSDSEDARQTERKPPKTQKSAGLGQIGGGKKPKGQKEKESKHTPSEEDEERSGTHHKAGNEKESPPVTSSPKPKPGGKLGMIGGAKGARKQTASQRQTSPPKSRGEAEETASGSEDEPAANREGKIKQETPSEEPALRPRSPTNAPARRSAWPKKEEVKKEEKEETPEERANRKREELRRQMEAKGPAKKKRKF